MSRESCFPGNRKVIDAREKTMSCGNNHVRELLINLITGFRQFNFCEITLRAQRIHLCVIVGNQRLKQNIYIKLSINFSSLVIQEFLISYLLLRQTMLFTIYSLTRLVFMTYKLGKRQYTNE